MILVSFISSGSNSLRSVKETQPSDLQASNNFALIVTSIDTLPFVLFYFVSAMSSAFKTVTIFLKQLL